MNETNNPVSEISQPHQTTEAPSAQTVEPSVQSAATPSRRSKSQILTRVIIVLALFAALLLLTSWAMGKVINKMIVSDDRTPVTTTTENTDVKTIKRQTYSVDMPKRFTDLPAAYRNADMDIAMGKDNEQTYVATVVESTADFDEELSVEEYAGLVHETYMTGEAVSLKSHDKITDRSIANPHNYDTADYRDVAVVDDIKIIYYRRYVKHKDNFYQVITWTLPSKETANKPMLIDIIASLRIGPDMVDSV